MFDQNRQIAGHLMEPVGKGENIFCRCMQFDARPPIAGSKPSIYEETVNDVLKICKQKAKTSKSIETLCQLW